MIELTTMSGAEAYAAAVEFARDAAGAVGRGENGTAQALASVAQAFAAVAAAEATARTSARGTNHYPAGGWRVHTHPEANWAIG
ncbi:hypothetical protein AB0M94_39525 [Streptomyces xanthochromogenes]|uniref:hypothetical protein n=1 Tax=Streptomyces xanthochromogenes TaxID=67384 RepID=UPI00342FBA61